VHLRCPRARTAGRWSASGRQEDIDSQRVTRPVCSPGVLRATVVARHARVLARTFALAHFNPLIAARSERLNRVLASRCRARALERESGSS